MSDVTYAVNFQQMDEVINDAKVRAARIKDLLEQMDNSTRSSLDNWIGSARSAYETAYQTCMNQALMMPATLDGARTTLTSIGDGYQSMERSAVNSFGG